VRGEGRRNLLRCQGYGAAHRRVGVTLVGRGPSSCEGPFTKPLRNHLTWALPCLPLAVTLIAEDTYQASVDGTALALQW
jgi:hypothetical protein